MNNTKIGSQEYFNEWFDYDDGALYWKKWPGSNQIKIGDRAGSKNGTGYRSIRLQGIHYQEHRVIWIMHNGDIPEGMEIDHINRIYDYNFIDNLRLASRMDNVQNSITVINSVSRYSCVYWHSSGCWDAHIQRDGKITYLGHYDLEEDAARAVNIFCRDNSIAKFNDIPEPFKIPNRRNNSAEFKSSQKGVQWNKKDKK